MAETQGYRVVDAVTLSDTDRAVVNTGYAVDGTIALATSTALLAGKGVGEVTTSHKIMQAVQIGRRPLTCLPCQKS